MRSLVVLACLCGLASAIVGPAWTSDPRAEAPAGERDMGGYTIAVYTTEQQARLGVDEFGKPQCNMPSNAYPPPSNTSIPWYTVNLDEDPKTRWNNIVTPLAKQIHDMIYSVIDLLPQKFAQEVLSLIDQNIEKILDALPAPFGDELRGIAAATGIDPSALFLMNIAYELEGGCTSIVAENKDNVPIHVRNMDFGLFLGWNKTDKSWQLADRLRPLLFNGRMQHNGQTVYNLTGFAGYIGVLSAARFNGFSITVDTRYDDTFYKSLIMWLKGEYQGTPLTMATRMTMEQYSTYSQALANLQTVPLLGPSYVILGGVNPGEGAVVTRSSNESFHLWTIANNLHNTSYYVLETNYDHWVTPPFYDNRVAPAELCLAKIGQDNISFSSLFNLLSGQPNFNLLTTHTVLMCPKTGQYESYIQKCTTHPCTPW